MSDTPIPDFFIGVFETLFGKKAAFYNCMVMMLGTSAGQEVLLKFIDFMKSGVAALKTPEGQRLLEEYKKAYPDA